MFDGAGTSVNDSFPLEVAVRGRRIRPEVLHAEFQTAELDDVALLEAVVVEDRIRLLLGLLLRWLLRFEIANHDEHHVSSGILSSCLVGTHP